jgi:hypothetical protein
LVHVLSFRRDYQLIDPPSIDPARAWGACSGLRRSLTSPGRTGYASARCFMNRGTESTNTGSNPGAHESAVGAFGAALRKRPIRTGLGLGVEYAMFAAGVGLAFGLFVTRVPLRIADRALGLRVRERFIELIARISPG